MLDKEKIKRTSLLIWDKTKYYASRFGKWLWAVCYVCWGIYKTYASIVVKRIRIRREFQSFGKEAYSQWKEGQYFSLKEKLNTIKEIEEEISELSVVLRRACEKFLDLCWLKPLVVKMRLRKLKNQTPEQPLQPVPTAEKPVPAENQPIPDVAAAEKKPSSAPKKTATPKQDTTKTPPKPRAKRAPRKRPAQKPKTAAAAKPAQKPPVKPTPVAEEKSDSSS